MPRMERVDDEICKALNEIIARELKDPRVSGVLINVTSVKTAKDLKNAKVYVSIMDENAAKDAVKALNNASVHIRGLLFERLKIRLVPYLNFVIDNSASTGAKIDEILKELNINNNAENTDDK